MLRALSRDLSGMDLNLLHQRREPNLKISHSLQMLDPLAHYIKRGDISFFLLMGFKSKEQLLLHQVGSLFCLASFENAKGLSLSRGLGGKISSVKIRLRYET